MKKVSKGGRRVVLWNSAIWEQGILDGMPDCQNSRGCNRGCETAEAGFQSYSGIGRGRVLKVCGVLVCNYCSR